MSAEVKLITAVNEAAATMDELVASLVKLGWDAGKGDGYEKGWADGWLAGQDAAWDNVLESVERQASEQGVTLLVVNTKAEAEERRAN